MNSGDFFREIEHTSIPWREYQLSFPLFYSDIWIMSVSFLVRTDRIRKILPSKRMKPYRLTPGKTLVTITAFDYRETDIGPYRELAIGIPITIDRETPMFTGILRRIPEIPMSYTLHLPVTTEIARIVGVEFAGYPKFLADIEFSEDSGWLRCVLKAENQHVLTLSGRKLPLKHVPRCVNFPITYRNGYILRSEFVISDRDIGTSRSRHNVELELGEHRIADELRGLEPGKVVGYSYCPRAQGILTPVIESYSG